MKYVVAVRSCFFTIRTLLLGACGLLLAFTVFPAAPARAQSSPPEQGGAGTIDPATVGLRTLLRFTIPNLEAGDYLGTRALATDAAGNNVAGSVISHPPTQFSGIGAPRSVISKFNPAGALLWQRERKISTVTVGTYPNQTTEYYETFSDDQTPVRISPYEANTSLELVSLATDAAGNVVAAFDVLYYQFNTTTGATLDYTQESLFVKFDPSGNFLWRRVSPPGADDFTSPYNTGFAAVSLLKSLSVGPDGSLLALIDNFNRSSGVHQSVVVKFAADGTRITTNHYGLDNSGNVLFASTPTTLTTDGTGNIFLLSTESPDPNQYPPLTPDQVLNVIRKLDPSGNALARKDVPVFPGYTPGSRGYPSESWAAARADAAGNLYVAGTRFRVRPSYSSPDQGEANQLVLKFGPDLTQLWRSLGPQPNRTYEDQPSVGVRDLALSAGGVTVGGSTTSNGILASAQDGRWEVTRYALDDGHQIWHRLYQSPAADPNQGHGDSLNALRVDTAGNVYASGFVAQPTGGGAIALIKYADNGDLQFVKVFPNDDIGRAAQAFTLSLPPATNRPTFYGQPPNENKEFVAFDFDNPAVVLAPPTSTHPPLFNGEVSLSNGVYFLAFATTGNPFGYYSYLSDPRFIYHFDLGYEYWFDAGDGKNGIYFYDFKSGSFFYTSPSFPFPYLYDFSLNATLYYYPDPNNPGHYNTNGVRYFYNYATGQIITK